MTSEERIEVEARKAVKQYASLLNQPRVAYASTLVEFISRRMERCVIAAVEKRERECIRIQCEMCASGNAPHRIDEVYGALSPWWEHCMEEGTADECDASPLHESIYQRDRKLREGNG